tara:strand:- start:25 stop:210 length:186 start_codon:yes stop_codon:yes gene_type:complete
MKTYRIVRYYYDRNKDNKVLLTGVTLEQARNHCNSKLTAGDGWFDGYTEEELDNTEECVLE